jgi:Family of unknown function (DUF5946)
MALLCEACGALLPEGETCQTIFERFMALEFSDPAYGVVHFLTVACFMIQHRRYSDEALGQVRAALHANLREGVAAAELRRRAAGPMDQTARTWKVLRQPDAPPLPAIAWDITIADVSQRARDAASYREQVTRWATRTLEQLESG